MTKSMWISALAAIIAIAASGVAYDTGAQYLPGVLMFVAAVIVLGLLMNIEDRLLVKYDTPHDDDHHPPPLVAFRAIRALVMIVMGVAIFAMAFRVL